MQGIGKIGNAYGQLYVKEENSKYYWGIDCDVNGMVWEKIPEYLYKSLVTYSADYYQMNLIKQLRGETGWGLMACKKALNNSNWEIDAAKAWLIKNN